MDVQVSFLKYTEWKDSQSVYWCMYPCSYSYIEAGAPYAFVFALWLKAIWAIARGVYANTEPHRWCQLTDVRISQPAKHKYRCCCQLHSDPCTLQSCSCVYGGIAECVQYGRLRWWYQSSHEFASMLLQSSDVDVGSFSATATRLFTCSSIFLWVCNLDLVQSSAISLSLYCSRRGGQWM